jgi:hypothetical protein
LNEKVLASALEMRTNAKFWLSCTITDKEISRWQQLNAENRKILGQ